MRKNKMEALHNTLQKVKCALGFHKEERRRYREHYPFRTTNKGRSKKRWHTTKVCVTEVYCRECGKLLKRNRNVKW